MVADDDVFGRRIFSLVAHFVGIEFAVVSIGYPHRRAVGPEAGWIGIPAFGQSVEVFGNIAVFGC